jgi:hypothetical protein
MASDEILSPTLSDLTIRLLGSMAVALVGETREERKKERG